jgi:hypothetical protein
VRLDRLGLGVGQKIAYVFDFGDEWRVGLTLAEIRPAGTQPVPPILESRGELHPSTDTTTKGWLRPPDGLLVRFSAVGFLPCE